MTDEQALQVLQTGLVRARRLHPNFADDSVHGLSTIVAELFELQAAVFCKEGPERERAEALDLAITAMRFYLGEHERRQPIEAA